MTPAHPTLLRHAVQVSRAAGPLAAVLAVTAGGCYYTDAGLPPPAEGFYFPTGLVVSPGRTALYVANSDFDLQFNGGTVQVLDLAGLRGTLRTLLSSIRCSEGISSECLPGVSVGASLKDLCATIPVSRGTGKAGDACTTPSDCGSGICPAGVCVACTTDAQCPAGAPADLQCDGIGKCDAGVCKLACNPNQILAPSPCQPLAPPFAGFGTVGAFASGAVLSLNPAVDTAAMLGNAPTSEDYGARLFVPVRGDPSITWFDLADDRVQKGAGTCVDAGQGCNADADCCTNSCDRTKGRCGFSSSAARRAAITAATTITGWASTPTTTSGT